MTSSPTRSIRPTRAALVAAVFAAMSLVAPAAIEPAVQQYWDRNMP